MKIPNNMSDDEVNNGSPSNKDDNGDEIGPIVVDEKITKVLVSKV